MCGILYGCDNTKAKAPENTFQMWVLLKLRWVRDHLDYLSDVASWVSRLSFCLDFLFKKTDLLKKWVLAVYCYQVLPPTAISAFLQNVIIAYSRNNPETLDCSLFIKGKCIWKHTELKAKQGRVVGVSDYGGSLADDSERPAGEAFGFLLVPLKGSDKVKWVCSQSWSIKTVLKLTLIKGIWVQLQNINWLTIY